jgi:hypothetical protein
MLYFIEDIDGNIGHPTRKADMVRRWLKNKKAYIKKRGRDWLLIKINKKIYPEKTISCEFRIGLDPGYNHIGFCVYKITLTKVDFILFGEAELRTKDITANMDDRRMYRRARRQFRRKNVLRKFDACKFRKPIWKNRRTHKFQPTHTHLIQSHLNVLNKIFQLVPKDQKHTIIEYAKFDIHKLKNPIVKGKDYQKGPQYGYENLLNYVRARDNYTCQLCFTKNPSVIEEHHIIPRRLQGPDTPDNLITLCQSCHKKADENLSLCKSNIKSFTPSGVLNSVMKEIYSNIADSKTWGFVVDAFRKHNKIQKTHCGDASIISFSGEKTFVGFDQEFIDNPSCLSLKEFRRHVRFFIQRYEDRKYYDGNTCVAWNRSARQTQDKKKIPLKEFRKKDKITKLKVKPGLKRYRRCNNKILFRPGDLLEITDKKTKKKIYDVCVGWASTQNKVITVDNGRVSVKTIRKICNNSGLTMI